MKKKKTWVLAGILSVVLSIPAFAEEFKESPLPRVMWEEGGISNAMCFRLQSCWLAIDAGEETAVEAEMNYFYMESETGYPIEARFRRTDLTGKIDKEISLAPKVVLLDRYSISYGNGRTTQTMSRWESLMENIFYFQEEVEAAIKAGLVWPEWSENNWMEVWGEP